MSTYDDFVTRVIALREAQKAYEEQPTRGHDNERKKCEMRVDTFIEKYLSERVQLALWSRAMQTNEEQPAYNVTHEEQTEKGGAA